MPKAFDVVPPLTGQDKPIGRSLRERPGEEDIIRDKADRAFVMIIDPYSGQFKFHGGRVSVAIMSGNKIIGLADQTKVDDKKVIDQFIGKGMQTASTAGRHLDAPAMIQAGMVPTTGHEKFESKLNEALGVPEVRQFKAHFPDDYVITYVAYPLQPQKGITIKSVTIDGKPVKDWERILDKDSVIRHAHKHSQEIDHLDWERSQVRDVIHKERDWHGAGQGGGQTPAPGGSRTGSEESKLNEALGVDSPENVCKCGHLLSSHDEGGGRCLEEHPVGGIGDEDWVLCGCLKFEPRRHEKFESKLNEALGL
jgi:hypothetical protein